MHLVRFFVCQPRQSFCEPDYAVTRSIAELINSLTNVVYIIYGIYGLRKLRQKMAVGLCSFAFHVSLKYHTQMSMSRVFATSDSVA
ncbi:uncharacterized protein CDV56_107419 [Aspergillus thermomutatus]|uniref:Uncharacterized protein n=1 Tax=Aspergillus thermomutatus TaxID=41047 RepID=A0A397GW31_ASPTH|nr:uncharacterized protein CDV56_107419 [Aspergillus thermomutatus]RHZ53273.1 hypothetical protein CDV56_107419 [Aspergillus thermomutatus]